MKQKSWLIAVVAIMAIGLYANRSGAQAPTKSLRAVVHINFSDADQQGRGLKNVNNVLKDVPDAEMIVVCHSPGIETVQKSKSKHADTIATLISKGVKFVACENTMAERNIPKDDLLPGVGTVKSGTVEVMRRQQAGFSYFKP